MAAPTASAAAMPSATIPTLTCPNPNHVPLTVACIVLLLLYLFLLCGCVHSVNHSHSMRFEQAAHMLRNHYFSVVRE